MEGVAPGRVVQAAHDRAQIEIRALQLPQRVDTVRRVDLEWHEQLLLPQAAVEDLRPLPDKRVATDLPLGSVKPDLELELAAVRSRDSHLQPLLGYHAVEILLDDPAPNGDEPRVLVAE